MLELYKNRFTNAVVNWNSLEIIVKHFNGHGLQRWTFYSIHAIERWLESNGYTAA